MKAGNVHVTSLFSLYTFIYLIPIPPSLCYLILFECHHSFMHFVRVYTFSFLFLLMFFYYYFYWYIILMKRKMPLDGDQSFLLFFQMNDENIKNCWCEGGMSVNIDMPSRAERF